MTCLAILRNQNLESCTGANLSAKGFKTGSRKGKLTEIKVKGDVSQLSNYQGWNQKQTAHRFFLTIDIVEKYNGPN